MSFRSDSCQSDFWNDAELTSALDARDPRCLSILFQRYSRAVLTLALHVLHDVSEAEEVVQEVFLYIYERPHLFDASKGSARTWVMCIAESRALDRRLYLTRRGFYGGLRFHILPPEQLAKSDLELETNSRLNRKRLEQALKILPPMQHRTIELFYFHGLELREISDRLGVPLGNVRHHLYRGLARLRKCSVLCSMHKSDCTH